MAKKKPEGEEPKKEAGATALSVFDKDGHFVRTYTTEMQYPEGMTMVSSAEGYARKIQGSVKKAA
ncbi:MAG: hypothetical protein NUV80_01045 [Candidatus Berkelbacteria bacterium]|nr:hypothetical protein [Candidatus Berkelbacteria bacterium]